MFKKSSSIAADVLDDHWSVHNAPDSPTIKKFIRTPKRSKNCLIKSPDAKTPKSKNNCLGKSPDTKTPKSSKINQNEDLSPFSKFNKPSKQSLHHLAVSPIVSKINKSHIKLTRCDEVHTSTPESLLETGKKLSTGHNTSLSRSKRINKSSRVSYEQFFI